MSERIPAATLCPAACVPTLAILPKPAAVPLMPPPAAEDPSWNAARALLAVEVAARTPLPAILAAAGAI
ncbi:hypothetical protein JTL80_34880, partial [Pseudomonas aeruginosa]|nr:hypothetical protein [Pseudomonas aeruginosa]